jgi:predicted MFS family arabinose efflux permease
VSGTDNAAIAPGPVGGGQMAACLAIGSIALLILGVQPVLLGPMVVEGRLSESGVGLTVTAEIFAIALGSIAGSRLLQRLPARALVAASGTLLAVVNAAMTLRHGIAAVIALRALAGLAEGLLLSLPIVAVARAKHPERQAAYFLVAQTLLQLIVAAIIPNLMIDGSRAAAGFAALAAVSALALPLAAFAPRILRPARADSATGRLVPGALAGLIGAAAYLGGIVVTWSYFGLFLARHGHPATLEGTAVATCLAAQIAGALAAARFSERLPPVAIITAAALVEALLLIVLLTAGGSTLIVYAFAITFGFMWLFALPAFTGLLVQLDPGRQAALYLAAAQLGGSAILPTLAGPAIERIGVSGALWFGIAAFAVTAMAVIVAARHIRRGMAA